MAQRLDFPRWAGPAALALLAAPVGILAGYEPRFAIAFAFAFAFVLLAFTDLAAGVAAFALLSFLQILPVDDIAKLAGGLLALSWFALVTTKPKAELEFLSVHPYASALIGAFLGWTLLSAAWSENAEAALGATGRYALDAVLFLIVYTAIRTRRTLGWVLLAFVLGAAIAAMIGIVSPTGEEAEGRLGSDILDPSQLSAVLVSGAALAAGAFALYRGNPLIRVITLAIGVFAIAGVWLTASRGGLVALGAALVAAVVLGGRWRLQITIGVALLAFCTYFYFAGIADPETRDRITATTEGQERIKEGRTTIWNVAWRAFEANPVEGVGAANFQHTSRHYLLQPGALGRSDEIIGENPKVVHNSYLEVATETGVVGFGLFSGIVAFVLGSTLLAARAFRRAGDTSMEAVSIWLAIALVGNLAALFFISDQYSKQLWLLMGLGPALLAIARATPAGEPRI